MPFKEALAQSESKNCHPQFELEISIPFSTRETIKLSTDSVYIHTHTHTHTYIYIYIYLCVGVKCTDVENRFSEDYFFYS